MLSIIIPTLDAEHHVARNLGALIDEAGSSEVLIVDGGSKDRTQTIAKSAGAQVIATGRGRGLQLAEGARKSAGNWLLFLHADTKLEKGWREAVDGFTINPDNYRRAAYFQFILDDDAPGARKLEQLVAKRCRRFGLPYGDQGLLISRGFYNLLGGYKEIPLMEDVNLVRRIGKRRLIGMGVSAITSADRYRKNGYRARSTRNATLLALYFMGVPASILARLYNL